MATYKVTCYNSKGEVKRVQNFHAGDMEDSYMAGIFVNRMNEYGYSNIKVEKRKFDGTFRLIKTFR